MLNQNWNWIDCRRSSIFWYKLSMGTIIGYKLKLVFKQNLYLFFLVDFLVDANFFNFAIVKGGQFFIHHGLFKPIISFNCWGFLLLEGIEPIFAQVIHLRPSLRALVASFCFWPFVTLLGCGDGSSNSLNSNSKFVSPPSSFKDSSNPKLLEKLKCWTCFFSFDYTFDDFFIFKGDPYLHFKCFFLLVARVCVMSML